MIYSKLYTIGYGNKTSKEVFSELKKCSIDQLIDVRSFPYSKFRPMFNKQSLESQAITEDIKYVFKGDELGAKSKEGALDYEVLRKTPQYMDGLRFLIDQLDRGYNIAIMCCELDYLKCHRYSLIGEDMFQLGYDVIHIGRSGELIKHGGLIL